MGEIGAAGDTQAAYDAYQNIGGYLSAYGFNVDFAPVADVLTNVDNTVIGNRAFSSDAGVAAQMVSSAVTGLQETGVSACLKHFRDTGTQQGILIPARRRRTGQRRRWKQRNFYRFSLA